MQIFIHFADGRQSSMRFFCVAHMRKKKIMLMTLLTVVGVLTLVVIFGIYATLKGKFVN